MDERKIYNFLNLPNQYSDFKRAKVAILPIPFDKTSSWLQGSDQGPDAIIEASMNIELYDIETASEVYKFGISTLDPIEAETSQEMIEKSHSRVRELLSQDKFVVTLGGEHTISFAPMKAHCECYRNMSILQFDAHTDMRDAYEGNPFSHACVMARISELVDNIVAVGIRSMDYSELARVKANKVFYAEQIYGSNDWISKVVSELSDNVYITFDLDVFDPSLMPSTGTPEPGGLGWYDVLSLLRAVAKKKNIVGFDVVELCPSSNKAPNFVAAKLIYKILSYKFC